MGTKYRRTRLWVDPAFQFRLLLRMGFYLLLYTVVVGHIAFVFQVMADFATNGARAGLGGLYMEFIGRQMPLVYALVLTMPIILHNLLKFSHRIAGPLYRCRKVLQEMARGKPVPEFTPRKHDLMRELFQAFNALIKEWNARLSAGVNGRLGDANTAEMMSEAMSPPPGK